MINIAEMIEDLMAEGLDRKEALAIAKVKFLAQKKVLVKSTIEAQKKRARRVPHYKVNSWSE